MSDETTTTDDESTGAPVAHDDIMKRLLDYQRQLRESSPSEEGGEVPRPMVDYSAIEAQAATATVTEQVVDLTQVENEEAAAEAEVIEVPEASETAEAPTDEMADMKKAEAEEMRRRVAEEAAAGSAERQSEEAPEPEASTAEARTETMSTSATEEELAARVAQLEAALDRIGMMLTAVRSDFQDLAIRADERIAEIETALAAVRGSNP